MDNKRGQFYLITAIIIVAMILGFATISNEIRKDDIKELDSIAEELEIEAQTVLDYSIYNKRNLEADLITFTQDYATYTDIDNIYFLFGDQTRVTVASLQKTNPSRVYVNGVEFLVVPNEYTSTSYDAPDNPFTISINNIDHVFDLVEGENFYFIISEGEEDGNYFFTGNLIQENEE